MPAALASVSRLSAWSEASIRRQARVTVAVRRSTSDGWSGVHRLQGRKPAATASPLVA